MPYRLSMQANQNTKKIQTVPGKIKQNISPDITDGLFIIQLKGRRYTGEHEIVV